MVTTLEKVLFLYGAVESLQGFMLVASGSTAFPTGFYVRFWGP